MASRYTVGTALLVGSLSVLGQAQAQTPGQIPVFIDTSGTLGDSTIAQDSSGNVSLTNATANPVLAVSNTNGDFGSNGIFGQSVNGNGVYGQSSGREVSGVYGESIASLGGYGVAGRAFSADGVGVFGDNANPNGGYGVLGMTTRGTGVYGLSGPNGHAGYFNGKVAIITLATQGVTPLCLNGLSEVATCPSSLRYKTDVQSFSGGLDIVNLLRPIAFTWKEGGKHDIGLAAEDVERVEPLLTFRNDKGEIEGVKYNQLSAVFVNAIRDQQSQIERQQVQIDALKGLVCQSHPDADVCR
jgi:hypothetical protein